MDNATDDAARRAKRKSRRAKRKVKRAVRRTSKISKRSKRKLARRPSNKVRTQRIKKRTGRKTTRVISRGIRAAKKGTVGGDILATIKPLEPAMKSELKRKGVNTSGMPLDETTIKFYNEFVSKKGNKLSSYEPIEESEFINNVAFVTPSEELDNDTDNIVITSAMITTAVGGIIGFFKRARERRQAAKDSGMTKSEAKQSMPGIELRIGKATEDIESDLIDKAVDNESVKSGQVKRYVMYAVIFLVVAGILYYFTKKK